MTKYKRYRVGYEGYYHGDSGEIVVKARNENEAFHKASIKLEQQFDSVELYEPVLETPSHDE